MFNNFLEPSNVSGSVSASSGSPLIQFNIGSIENQALIGSSVRLNGKIKFSKAGGAIGDVGVLLNNIGIYSTLSQIQISGRNGSDIETINNYNRYLASAFKSTLSIQKQMNSSTISNLSSPNLYVSTKSLLTTMSEKPFSLELPCGILSSGDVPLGLDQTGGISINLKIAQNSNVFHGTDVASRLQAQGCEYELLDLNLTFNTRPSTPEELKMKSMEYNSIQTFTREVSNNHNSINLNIGLSKVISMFANFLPQEHDNNYNYDGLSVAPFEDNNNLIDNITKIQILKGGQKTPYLFDLETYNNSNHQLSTQLARNFKSVFVNNIHTTSECYRSQTNTPPNFKLLPIDANFNYGIGVNYNKFYTPVNFSRDQFTLIIDKTSINPKPYLAFCFFKNVNKLNFLGNGNVSIEI